jgi:hypothetical protein
VQARPLLPSTQPALSMAEGLRLTEGTSRLVIKAFRFSLNGWENHFRLFVFFILNFRFGIVWP